MRRPVARCTSASVAGSPAAKRAKIGWWALLLPVGAIAVLGAVSRARNTVEAERFVLRDAEGVQRASLSISESGCVVLQFLTAEGSPALRLLVDDRGHPEIDLVGPVAGQEANLACMMDGTSQLLLRSGSGVSSCLAAGGFSRLGALKMEDGEGRMRMSLGLDGDSGELRIQETDDEGPKDRLRLGATRYVSWVSVGEGIMHGSPRAEMKAERGGPDAAGTPRAVLSLQGAPIGPPPDLRPEMPREEGLRLVEEFRPPSVNIDVSGAEGAISISRQGGKEVWRVREKQSHPNP